MIPNLNSKKSLFVFSLYLLFTISISSAQKYYLYAGGGYGLAAATEVFGVKASPKTEENIYYSFGKGIVFNAGYGYPFSENIFAEFGFSYLSGATYKIINNGFLSNSNDYYSFNASANMMRFLPMLKLTCGEKIKPYTKIGMVIGFSQEIIYEGSGSGNSGGAPYYFIYKDNYSGGTCFGWNAALGADFILNTRIAVYGELMMINQSYAPTKYVSTHSSSGSLFFVNPPGTYSLVDKINISSSHELLKHSYPFSSIGLNAGIKVSFGNNVKK